MVRVIHNVLVNPRHATPEIIPEKSQVERETYVSLSQQITEMIRAGQRLQDYRRFNYDMDHAGDFETMEVDPTRYPGFTPALASQMAMKVNAKIKEMQAELASNLKNPGNKSSVTPESQGDPENDVTEDPDDQEDQSLPMTPPARMSKENKGKSGSKKPA